MTRRNRLRFWAILFFGLTSCAPAQFDFVTGASDSDGLVKPTKPRVRTGQPLNPNVQVVCDPLSDDNQNIDAEHGLNGEIRYLSDDQPRYSTMPEYLQNAHLVNAEVYLSQVNTPTRTWEAGFQTGTNSFVTRDDGQKLVEWFSLSLRSYLTLGRAETSGTYQFAVIADDGATFELSNSKNQVVSSIDVGWGPTKLGCGSQQTVQLQKGRFYPLKMNYVQAPRYHIALMLLWRKVDPKNIPVEPLCDLVGNDAFFDSSVTPSAPTANFQELQARGWKVVGAENFILDEGTNKCAL